MTVTELRAPDAATTMTGHGWIPWYGGDCPVAPETPVQIRLGIEETFDEDQPIRRADTWRWDHGTRCRRANIIAYLVAAA